MYRHPVIVTLTFATVTVRNRDLISSCPSTADVVKQDIMQRHLVIVAHCIVGEPGCTATVTLHPLWKPPSITGMEFMRKVLQTLLILTDAHRRTETQYWEKIFAWNLPPCVSPAGMDQGDFFLQNGEMWIFNHSSFVALSSMLHWKCQNDFNNRILDWKLVSSNRATSLEVQRDVIQYAWSP